MWPENPSIGETSMNEIYKVKPGDTLSKIAKEFWFWSWKDLLKLQQPWFNSNKLSLWQEIRVKEKSKPVNTGDVAAGIDLSISLRQAESRFARQDQEDARRMLLSSGLTMDDVSPSTPSAPLLTAVAPTVAVRGFEAWGNTNEAIAKLWTMPFGEEFLKLFQETFKDKGWLKHLLDMTDPAMEQIRLKLATEIIKNAPAINDSGIIGITEQVPDLARLKAEDASKIKFTSIGFDNVITFRAWSTEYTLWNWTDIDGKKPQKMAIWKDWGEKDPPLSVAGTQETTWEKAIWRTISYLWADPRDFFKISKQGNSNPPKWTDNKTLVELNSARFEAYCSLLVQGFQRWEISIPVDKELWNALAKITQGSYSIPYLSDILIRDPKTQWTVREIKWTVREIKWTLPEEYKENAKAALIQLWTEQVKWSHDFYASLENSTKFYEACLCSIGIWYRWDWFTKWGKEIALREIFLQLSQSQIRSMPGIIDILKWPNNIHDYARTANGSGWKKDIVLALKLEPLLWEDTAQKTPDREVAELTPEQYRERLTALRNAQVNGGKDFYNSPENRVAFYTSALWVLWVSTDIDKVNPSIQTQERILWPRFAKIDTALLRWNPDIATCIRAENNIYNWANTPTGQGWSNNYILAMKLANV